MAEDGGPTDVKMGGVVTVCTLALAPMLATGRQRAWAAAKTRNRSILSRRMEFEFPGAGRGTRGNIYTA